MKFIVHRTSARGLWVDPRVPGAVKVSVPNPPGSAYEDEECCYWTIELDLPGLMKLLDQEPRAILAHAGYERWLEHTVPWPNEEWKTLELLEIYDTWRE